jgi:hypothetical protein
VLVLEIVAQSISARTFHGTLELHRHPSHKSKKGQAQQFRRSQNRFRQRSLLPKNKKGQAQQFRDSQNRISQLSLLPILSTDVRWAALEALRGEVANDSPLGDARFTEKNGD